MPEMISAIHSVEKCYGIKMTHYNTKGTYFVAIFSYMKINNVDIFDT